MVRPNGTVIVPYRPATPARSARSGPSTAAPAGGPPCWSSTISHHTVAGGLADQPLPSAEVDAAGTVYVVWQDCRFRSGCAANDIVMSKSTSETTWGAGDPGADRRHRQHRRPLHPRASASTGRPPAAAARIGLTYYFYPNRSCTAATCQLDVGFISSTNGGASWSTATQLAGPMTLSWLPNTSQGRMVGDYISTSVLPGGSGLPGDPGRASRPAGGTIQRGDVRAHRRPVDQRRRPPSPHRPGAGTKRHRPPDRPRIWIAPPRPLTQKDVTEDRFRVDRVLGVLDDRYAGRRWSAKTSGMRSIAMCC